MLKASQLLLLLLLLLLFYIYIYTAIKYIHIFPVGNSLFISCVEELDIVSPYYSIIVGYIFMLVSAAFCGFFYQLCTPCVVGYLV
jgi:hypothetical protein